MAAALVERPAPIDPARLSDFGTRDRLVASFRRAVYSALGIVLFPKQADWQLAGDGWTLLDDAPAAGDRYTLVRVVDPDDTTFAAEDRSQRTLCVPRKIVPRRGGRAHHLTNLASYKFGKSWGGAAYLTGFAILPSVTVNIIGVEYGICEPEFNYLCDFLCAEPPRGMGLKYRQLLNDKRGGRMRLALKPLMPGGHGAVFECRSWERKEGLKGAKVLCYYWAEAYQFGSMDSFNAISQNVRELRGFSVWTTTPDEPWVGFLHDMGHDPNEPDWHCCCGADDRANPYTFDQRARDRDDPDKGGIMTRERFEISHNGRLGTFVGRVYSYLRGEKVLTTEAYPEIWK